MILAELTKRGFDAQGSVNIVNRLSADIAKAASGGDYFLLIDDPAGDGVLDFARLDNNYPAQLSKAIGGLFVLINLSFFWTDLSVKRLDKSKAGQSQ